MKYFNKRSLTTALAVVLGGLLISFTANAGIYMQVPGVTGDVTVHGHEREIAVQSFQWGLAYDTTSKRGCTSSSDITISKMLDSATPALISSTIVGQTYPNVKITWSKEGPAGTEDYLTLQLTNAQFVSYSNSSGGDRPNESIALHFDSMTGKYITYSPDGKPGTPVNWTLVDQSTPVCR